jgi:hypothetical protein
MATRPPTAPVKQVGIPPSFQNLVLNAVTDGGVGTGGAVSQAEHFKNAVVAKIATKIVNAALPGVRVGIASGLEISASCSSWGRGLRALPSGAARATPTTPETRSAATERIGRGAQLLAEIGMGDLGKSVGPLPHRQSGELSRAEFGDHHTGVMARRGHD